MTDFEAWVESLADRHQADLTFTEIARSLRALSSAYVERRQRLREGAALSSAGKRAAFAIFYGPIHYLLVREIVGVLPGATAPARILVDLGCGSGASGAAWATHCVSRPRVVGIDRHPWALAEAARAYRAFHLRETTRQGDVAAAALPPSSALLLAAFTVNELPDEARDRLLTRLLEHRKRSNADRVLVVEPLARRVAPWWPEWRDAFEQAGGRADEWRIQVDLPPIVEKLDRASGLNHRELTGRSLWLV